MQHLLSIKDLEPDQIRALINRAGQLKAMHYEGKPHRPLEGKTLGMIFEKSSTRTRVSFEAGMVQLGGHALFLSPDHIQMGRGEPVRDTARVLSRYVDGVMIRTFSQDNLTEFARYSTVPVINGLSDLLHPCQILSDLLTIREKRGSLEATVAYLGDGNNVANSWINAAALLGFGLRLSCPEGYGPDQGILDSALEHPGADIRVSTDPGAFLAEADVLYTDVWVSMGQEKEADRRLALFGPFRVDGDMLARCPERVLVMHCLPAHRGEEITDEVIEGPHSIVFDQAENRLHMQKAILEQLMGSRAAGEK